MPPHSSLLVFIFSEIFTLENITLLYFIIIQKKNKKKKNNYI